jgi:hypothetical protein
MAGQDKTQREVKRRMKISNKLLVISHKQGPHIPVPAFFRGFMKPVT